MLKHGRRTLMRAAWFVALTVCMLVPPASRAELLEAELKVNGMACPFCAFGIEKKLRAIEGVQDLTVFLDEGRIELVFSPENGASASDIEAAVKEAGFKLSGLRLEVRGTLARDTDTPVLDAGRNLRFLLLDGKNEGAPLVGEALEKLRASAESGVVVVNGTAQGKVDGLPGLVLIGTESSGGGTR